MLFESGATVTVGGQPATNVNVTGPTQITATTPAFRRDRSTTSSSRTRAASGGTLVNGWVADFADVPNSQQFYFQITKLVANAITVGCGTRHLLPAELRSRGSRWRSSC